MATRNCANCSYAEVNNALNGVAGGSGTWTGDPADEGDIIVLPANKPTSGTFTITYGANTTTGIAYNASAPTVQTAINALASITSDGGVTVTITGAVYQILWNVNGVRATAMTGTGTSLSPVNDVSIDQVIVGASTRKEQRSISIGTSWASTLMISTGVELRGAGNVTGDHTVDPASWVTDDQTVILDNVILSSGYAAMFDATFSKNQTFRMTGITVRKGERTGKSFQPGLITIRGECPEDSGGLGSGSIRVDHCHFEQIQQIGMWWSNWTYGLCDHCKWTCGVDAQSTQAFSMNNGDTYGGSPAGGEIGSWAYPTEFGSEKFVFVEDCLFFNLGTAQTPGKIDGQYGGRFVVRYCHYYNTSIIGGHGTESGGFNRGIRASETYENLHSGTISQNWGESRSGTKLIYNNTWTGLGGTGMPLNVHRMYWAFKMGGSTGNGPFDKNATASDGSWTEAAAPYLFASGTASIDSTVDGSSNGVVTATGSPGWTVNAFAGKVLQNTDQFTTSGPVPCLIISNTANTITFSPDDGGYSGVPAGTTHASKKFVAGEHFEVYQVLSVVDQVGFGMCTDHIGTVKIDGIYYARNLDYDDQRWPHQAREPIYAWGNTANSVRVDASSGFPVVVENREYYNQNPSFTSSPTTGIGVGLRSARPSSGLVAGVGYWATDESILYVATGSTTWSTYYTPYQYPHRLIGGATGKIILLSGSLHFGNVVIGDPAPTATLHVQNTGDTLLTITGPVVSSNGKFTLDSTAGFTVAAGATHDIVVTYTPTTETLDNCTITFNSDADSGTETIAASGTGVPPVGGGGGGRGKGHKKGVLVQRGR